METKVSGTGWLCIKRSNGEWLPVVKLTEDQQLIYKDYVEYELEKEKCTIP